MNAATPSETLAPDAGLRFGSVFADRGRARVLLLVAASGIGVLLLYACRNFFHDDSYITLRYVANWLAGDGLGFNPGERVEGFTHPLWVFQVAGLGAAGVDLVSAPRLLGYGYFALLVAIWAPARAATLFLLPVVTLYGLVLWTGGGLEVAGFSCLLVLAGWQTIEAREHAERAAASHTPPICAGLALAAAGLMRPEGVGVAALALTWVALARNPRATAAMGAAFAVPMLAYLAFRLSYYGDYLPNSARAKIDGLPLAEQLWLAGRYLFRVRGEWVPALTLALGGLSLCRSRSGWLLAGLSLPVWGGLMLGGGDHMPGARLVIPALVLCLYAAGFAARERARAGSAPAGLAPLVVALAIWQAIPMWLERPEVDAAARLGERVGRTFDQHFPAGTVVAVATAGTTPYFAPSLRFIDMLGLNDPAIARHRARTGVTRWQQIPGHRKGWGRYVLERDPDVIVLGPSLGFLGVDFRRWFLGDFELLMSDDFYRRYSPYRTLVRAPAKGRQGEYSFPLVVYLRNDSDRVDGFRQIARAVLPPYQRPPNPDRIPPESIEPLVDQPAVVPLLRPVLMLAEAIQGSQRADE